MTQTERELQRLSERIVIHEERISDARDDDDDLSKALEKQRDSIDNVRDDIANLRSLVAVQTALLDDLKSAGRIGSSSLDNLRRYACGGIHVYGEFVVVTVAKMTMSEIEPYVAYQSFSPGEQVRFLLRFGWRSTKWLVIIMGRNPRALKFPAAVREINELQHHVLSHALSVQMNEQPRFPDDVFVAIVIDNTSEANGLRNRVESAFAETYREFRPREAPTMMA